MRCFERLRQAAEEPADGEERRKHSQSLGAVGGGHFRKHQRVVRQPSLNSCGGGSGPIVPTSYPGYSPRVAPAAARLPPARSPRKHRPGPDSCEPPTRELYPVPGPSSRETSPAGGPAGNPAPKCWDSLRRGQRDSTSPPPPRSPRLLTRDR